MGSIPGRDIPKSLKMVLSCSSLGIHIYGVELELVDPDIVTGYGIMSSVLGMILQWGSNINLSIELPVATRHCRDMTENLLKATLNPNK